MGTQVRYGTIAVGAYGAHWSGAHQQSFRDQYEPRWDRGGAVGPKTWRDRHRFASLWSYGCSVGGGNGDAEMFPLRNSPNQYAPFSCDGAGTQSIKWIKGQCLDVSGNVAAGAIVQCYRTSDDLFTGEVNANSTDGTFDVPTPYAGVNHYLVAYKPGSPDIGGTTVNTLTPTNIDGT